MISIESVPIEKHWFEELFGAPAYDEEGSPNALTIEEIRNSTSMLNPGSMPGELRYLEQSLPRARKLCRCGWRAWRRHAPQTMALLRSFSLQHSLT